MIELESDYGRTDSLRDFKEKIKSSINPPSGTVSAPPSPTKPPGRRKHHAADDAKDTSSFGDKSIPMDVETRQEYIRTIRRRSVSDVPYGSTTLANLPTPADGSPAFDALERASVKPELKITDKRMRIGKKKLGRTRYNSVRRRGFNRPKGKQIDDNHEQYALTYGMMSGILNSVGLQNQFKKNLHMNDFMRVDKKAFPASSKLKHPFKFKDYSPDVFRQIRRRFSIDDAEYMLTLCGDFNFIEFISNSKSGQFFFYSHDGRYMIKTQTKAESKFLRRILPHYYKFVMNNPNTLISRFYGMHRVKMHHIRRKMHFVIMANVFDTSQEIQLKYDLKGSKIGRLATEKDRKSGGVLKDLDLINGPVKLQLGPERRAMLLEQIRKDVGFLKKMKIMDYSLLLGIHDTTLAQNTETSMKRVQSDISVTDRNQSDLDTERTPRAMRSVSLPDKPENLNGQRNRSSINQEPEVYDEEDSESPQRYSEGSSTNMLSPRSPMASTTTYESVYEDDMEPISPRSLQFDSCDPCCNTESIFARDEGGMYARDADGNPMDSIYFLGIIDILQQYNGRKIAETFFKGFRHNRKQISAVNPNFYGDRFIEFMDKHVLKE